MIFWLRAIWFMGFIGIDSSKTVFHVIFASGKMKALLHESPVAFSCFTFLFSLKLSLVVVLLLIAMSGVWEWGERWKLYVVGEVFYAAFIISSSICVTQLKLSTICNRRTPNGTNGITFLSYLREKASVNKTNSSWCWSSTENYKFIWLLFRLEKSPQCSKYFFRIKRKWSQWTIVVTKKTARAIILPPPHDNKTSTHSLVNNYQELDGTIQSNSTKIDK